MSYCHGYDSQLAMRDPDAADYHDTEYYWPLEWMVVATGGEPKTDVSRYRLDNRADAIVCRDAVVDLAEEGFPVYETNSRRDVCHCSPTLSRALRNLNTHAFPYFANRETCCYIHTRRR